MSDPGYSAVIREGAQLRAIGNYDEAMALFSRLILEYPRDITAYLEAGQTQYADKNPGLALDWFKRAELIAPNNFWPYFRQARVLASMRQYAQALAIAETGLRQCQGRVSDLEYTNLIKLFLDIKALYIEKNASSVPFSATKSPVMGRPVAGALHVGVVKDAEDIIFASLEASYRAGIRYFALADNTSSDDTRLEIDRFKAVYADCMVFIVTDPIVGHHQAAKLMGLLRMVTTVLKETGVELDWIFPLDADELLHVSAGANDLAGLLEIAHTTKKNMMVYYHYNASSSKIYASLPAGADVGSLFPKIGSLPPAPVRKVAFRNIDAAYVEEGSHFCSGLVASHDDVIHGGEAGVFLLHFPVRSLDQLRSKIINGGRSISPLSNPSIGAHWRVDYNNYTRLGEPYLLQRINSYNLQSDA